MGITQTEHLRAQGIDAPGPTLLLLRHGQIRANKTGHWHGSTDGSLTFWGRRQARKTSRFLKHNNQRIDRVVASPLQRCQQTAKLASQHLDLDLETNPGLAEMNIGDWEGTAFSQLHEEHDFFTKLNSDVHFRPPNGESVADVSARMLSALTTISTSAAANEIVLVVSHGVAMGIALAELLDSDATRWREFQMGNCALSEFCLVPEPSLLKFNQTAHI